MHFLDAQRGSVLSILDGLDTESLNARILPSGWSPLGLIEHLGHAERYWFQVVAMGKAADLPWSDDDGLDGNNPLHTRRSPEVVFAFYRDQCRRSNLVLASTPLSMPPAGPVDVDTDDEVSDLRWIALHMIEETARHAGHLDVVRELIDGRTGLGPR
ncbi:DinB family protein [Planosporangium sp. 12N6]|uniref:DinB family protein n=1 Tax=Planosporangium spinosum TaxID=3402278 RepID=UPI003CF1C2B5